MAIEIFQNTLLKLIARSGPDSDRKNVTLSRGEFGWATDTNRLYVGDGTTLGGILVGNVFKGSNADVTSLAPASVGDLAFDSDNRILYRLLQEDGSSINNWQQVGGVYVAGDGIAISPNNVVSTTSISAGKLAQDSVASPIIIDTNGRLGLSANIPLDGITLKSAPSFSIPSTLNVSGATFTLPSSYPLGGFPQMIGNDTMICGPISLSSVSVKNITVTNGLTAYANGVNVTGIPINPLSASLIIGISPTLSSTNMGARYNGVTNTLVYSKGITSVTKLGTGYYQFNYPTSSPNMFPSTQLFGLSSMTYIPRVISISNTECIVRIANASLTHTDAEISITLTS